MDAHAYVYIPEISHKIHAYYTLQKDHGWTGLLVEPGKEMFQEILMRHRKAWHSNSCIATKAFPHQVSEFNN